MSTNTLQLACLLYGDDDPRDHLFIVDVDPSIMVAELKDTMRSKLPKAVRECVLANDLTLWHVSIPFQDIDDKAKWSQIRLDSDNSDVERMLATRPLSEFFSVDHQPRNDKIHHILVQLPSDGQKRSLSQVREGDAKRQKLDLDQLFDTPGRFRKDSPETMKEYWDISWGNPLPPNATELPIVGDENADAGDEDVDLLPGSPVLDAYFVGNPNPRFLIRAEYIRIYEYVESVWAQPAGQGNPPAVVITGHPGIGKSVWIHYALRRRLGEKLPTILYWGDAYHYFTASGVRECDNTRDLQIRATELPWCLIDSPHAPDGIPVSMRTWGRQTFLPVYLTFPNQTSWAKLHKTWKRHLAIMNPWTWREIESAAQRFHPTVKLEDVRKRFYEAGPTARICFDFSAEEVIDFKKRYLEAIETPTDVSHLFKGIFAVARGLITGSQVDLMGPTQSLAVAGRLSPMICMIRRPSVNEVSQDIVVSPTSKSIINDFMLVLQKRNNHALLQPWNLLSKFPEARGLNGAIFEAYAHLKFPKKFDINARPMFRKGRYHALFPDYNNNNLLCEAKKASLATTTIKNVYFSISFSRSVIYDNEGTIPTEEGVYYRPNIGHQLEAGIDASFIHDGHLYLLRYTVGITHGIKSGLAKFLERLQPLPSEDKRHFIFVLPVFHVEGLSCPVPSSPFESLPLYTLQLNEF